jgi:predicted transcriptional regulator
MSSAVTLRLDNPELLNRLDRLAKSADRSRNWLMNRALEEFVELQSWQVAKVEEGIAAANAGDFVPPAEMEAFFAEFGPLEVKS